MATKKVGVYRKYHEPVPKDDSGKPLPQKLWPKVPRHSWAVRWFGDDGKRYSRSFKTRKEAERYAEIKQAEIRDGLADEPDDISLRDFIKEHRKLMPGQVAKETLSDQLRALTMFADHVGQDRLLRNIKPRDAESFVSARLQAKWAIPTVNKDIRTLKRVFNLAIEPRGYLRQGQNPFGKARQRKETPKQPHYVAYEEFQKLLGVTNEVWWHALLLVAYTAGPRLDEIINLTWRDVDFETKEVRVTPKASNGVEMAWEPKDREERLLPLPEAVVQLLADLQGQAPEGCPYVFVTARRWEYIQKARAAGTWDDSRALVNNLIRRLGTLRKRAGVAKFTYHDLRRTCITNWARQLPVHVVQKLVGHSDIRTTQKYYLSVQKEDFEKARAVQAELLASGASYPKLTHSDENDVIADIKAEGPET